MSFANEESSREIRPRRIEGWSLQIRIRAIDEDGDEADFCHLRVNGPPPVIAQVCEMAAAAVEEMGVGVVEQLGADE